MHHAGEPPDTHTYISTPAPTHADTCINTYICIYVHPFTHTDTLTSNKPRRSLQRGEDNKSAPGLGLIHMLRYYDVAEQTCERVKYITHMQIPTDGMTARPGQSFVYVYLSLA